MAFLFQAPPIVSIVARPDNPSAWIRLVGELDIVAEPVLAQAVDRFNVRPLRLIVIDLTAVTFACSTLANFIAALHRAHPDADLVLHRPSRMVRFILAVTGQDEYVTVPCQPVGSNVRQRPGRWQAIDRRRAGFGNSAIGTPDSPT